jgi:hypothetical protein
MQGNRGHGLHRLTAVTRTFPRPALVLFRLRALLAGCASHAGRVAWRLRYIHPDGRVLSIDALRGECGGKAYAAVEDRLDGHCRRVPEQARRRLRGCHHRSAADRDTPGATRRP